MPLFALIIVSVAYLECTKTSNTQYEDLSTVSNLEPVNLKYMMYSVVIICIPASGARIYFQNRSLKHLKVKDEWHYNISDYLMWISIIFYIYAARKLIYKVERDDNHDRLTTFKLWKEVILLWIVNMTAQLVSWHLVFVICGFILNPLRALLYSMVIIVTMVCLVVLVAIIIKLVCTVTCRGNQTLDNRSVDNSSHCIDVVIMFSLIMLLICAFAYIVFIFQISITINNQTIEDVTQSIVPSVFLIIIAWLLPKLYLDPNTLLKYITKN